MCIFFYICKKYLSEDPALIFYLFQAPRRHPAITYCKYNAQDNSCKNFFHWLLFSFIFSFICRITLLFHRNPLIFCLTDIICRAEIIITSVSVKKQPYIRFFIFFIYFNCQCIILRISYTSNVTSKQTTTKEEMNYAK